MSNARTKRDSGNVARNSAPTVKLPELLFPKRICSISARAGLFLCLWILVPGCRAQADDSIGASTSSAMDPAIPPPPTASAGSGASSAIDSAIPPTPTASAPVPPGWCSPSAKPGDDFLVIGYLPDYRTLEPAWGNCLTDLIYFSAEPLPDGTLDTSLFTASTLNRMREMKSLYGIRLHFSLGGWGRSKNFGVVMTDPLKRRILLDELLEFAESNSLDGIDFDWEFPESPAELEGYLQVMKSVRQAGLTVSVAIFPDPDLDFSAYREIERIHIMSYDHEPRHSTYEQSIADLDVFLQAGFSRRQLILGVPFYGRKTTRPYTSFTYSEIVKKYSPSPQNDEVDGIFFNGIITIQKKVCYTLENGFGGIMIWELGQDSADESSLLRAVSYPLANGCQS